MTDLKIYCFTIKNYKILEKLPKHILPLGLGNNQFPNNFLNEKQGANISNLNKYYGEASGLYWIWKNEIKNMNKNNWIGSCNYRKLWLDKCYNKKILNIKFIF